MSEKIETKKEELKEAEVKEPEMKTQDTKEPEIKEPIVPTEVKEVPVEVKEVPEVPEICTFKGVRRIVMKRVWDKADKLEAEGKPMLIGDFGKMVSAEWDIIRKEIPKVCLRVPIQSKDLDKSEVLIVQSDDLAKLEGSTAEPSAEPSAKPSLQKTELEKAELKKTDLKKVDLPSKKDSVE